MDEENNGVKGPRDRRTVHLESVKLVQLLKFALMPKGPSRQLFEAAAGEVAKRLFFRGHRLRSNGTKGQGDGRKREGGRGVIVVREADRSDSANIGERQCMDVGGVQSVGGFKKVEFAVGPLELFGVETTFRGKDEIDDGGTTIVKHAETGDNICGGENRGVVDTYDIGTANFVVGGFGRGKNM
jgi:hypothetical protein